MPSFKSQNSNRRRKSPLAPSSHTPSQASQENRKGKTRQKKKKKSERKAREGEKGKRGEGRRGGMGGGRERGGHQRRYLYCQDSYCCYDDGGVWPYDEDLYLVGKSVFGAPCVFYTGCSSAPAWGGSSSFSPSSKKMSCS